MAGFSDDNVMMQQYYGSFPTTSKETAVSRKVGIRKVNITPVSNASGPSGETPRERPFTVSGPMTKEEIDEYIASRGWGSSNVRANLPVEPTPAPKSTSSKTLMYVAAYALAAGVAFLAYKKFKE
jgi:hypothetical protein